MSRRRWSTSSSSSSPDLPPRDARGRFMPRDSPPRGSGRFVYRDSPPRGSGSFMYRDSPPRDSMGRFMPRDSPPRGSGRFMPQDSPPRGSGRIMYRDSPPRGSGRFMYRDSPPRDDFGRFVSRRSPPREPNASLGEQIAKEHLENKYGAPFPKVRPDWLKNPHTGRNLELDGYNEDLNIAVEYHGRQHYEYSPDFFHRNGVGDFEEQRWRDSLTRRRCKAQGVTLVEVHDQIPPEKIPTFIDEELRRLGRR